MNKIFCKPFLNFRKEIALIKNDYWLMLAILFFMKIGQFMLLPFLAIYLVKYSNLSPIMIGFIIGIGPVIYGVVGLIGGVLIDCFGIIKTLVWSLFLGGLSSILFFYIHSVVWYLLMNVLASASRCIFDIGNKSYGVSGLSSGVRKTCFSLRFMIVNCSAAIGPAIGTYFAIHNSLFSFKVIGLLYFLLGLLSWFFFSETDVGKIPHLLFSITDYSINLYFGIFLFSISSDTSNGNISMPSGILTLET